MKRLVNKDLATRAGLTFIQAFVGALIVLDEPVTTNIVLSALASSLSLVWHQVITPAYRALRK